MSRRIALIVGISQYESRTGLHSLSAPVNDAQRVYDVLSEYGDFDMLYPLPLADGEVGSSGKVYAHDLQAKLCEVLSPSADEEVDLAVFYFSGHGVSERGQVVYLSTSDERLAIAIPWLAELVKTSAVKNVCIWLDCCHSGEVLKFTDLGERGFCVVAASHAEGEALARADGNSLLTDILCKALTPSADCQEIQVKHFINELEQQRHNLPQQVLCRWSDTPFTLTQLNGEVARESSSLRKPARGWVWHSTDESIAAGQISVLSVLETFFALGLYGWLAFHFEHQWWLLISAVAAPIILLRSPESKALGVKWLKSYKHQSSLDWAKLARSEKYLLLLISIMFFIVTYLLFFDQLSQQIENTANTWKSFKLIIFYTLAFTYVALIVTTLIGKASEVLLTFLSIPTIFACLTYLTLQTNTSAILGIIISLVLSYYLISISLNNTGHIIFIIPKIIAGGCIALGIWLRALLIRLLATLVYFFNGINHISKNWHETLCLVDLSHPPELLPGSTQVSLSFSVKGNLELIKTNKKDSWVYIMLITCWYPAAIMWRWSLKATLWLWFPLALLLRPPFEEKSLGEVRDIAAIRINGLGKWLPLLAVVLMLWLSSGYFSPENIKSWAELGGDTISKLLDKLLTIAPPPPGLRHWALWLVCGLSIIMWWLSDRLQIMHKKVLEEEDALDGLTKERRNLFLQRAHRLERWHTARVVSFILLGYSFVLYLANEWYPLELGRFVPAWLIGWL